MRHSFNHTLPFLLLFAGTLLYGESEITFRLDMGPMIEEDLFSPIQGERIFVRGSFNQWSGTDMELERLAGGNVYSQTFTLDQDPGDTVQYKYVIRRNRGGDYWESNPDPTNPDYGNRILVIGAEKSVLPISHFHYDEYFRYPVVFSREKVQEDFVQMRELLEEIHPALYDYTGKEALDSVFDNSYDKIDGALDFEACYTLLSTVMAHIGCGHSSLWIPADFWKVAPDRFFPLKLKILNGLVYVSGDYGITEGITAGSELLSVNGKHVMEIIKVLEASTSADGFNQSNTTSRVEREFSKKYAICYGFPDHFQVSYRAPGQNFEREALLDPVSIDLIDKSPWNGNELSFKEIEGASTGVLTINTFAYYDRVEMFHSFMDSVFQVIRERGINNLILDLRKNGGGDPFCSSYLFSYLEQVPVPYFAEPYGKYAPLAEPIPRSENYFAGNLITLIDGHGFSTTGHFCALLKYHKIGVFAGSELGATYTCTGNAQYIDLLHTRILLGTARETRYSAAVRNMDRTRGIIPDFPVEQSQVDIANGIDRVMDFALSLAVE